jgi:sulfatase modifying factor 1
MRSTITIVAASALALGLLRAVATWAADAPAAPPAAPAPAKPADVAKFFSGWAEAVGTEIDATTGYPKRVKRTKDSMVMVLIPAGTFQMGAVPGDAQAQDDEKPRHAVTLSKAYYMDEHEVTNEQFDRFATATGHKTTAEDSVLGGNIADDAGSWSGADGGSWRAPLPGGKRPSDWAKHPVVLVSWSDAKAFAGWSGSSLPTEAQFERAVRGGREDQEYPWGNELPPSKKAGNFADESAKRAFPNWQGTLQGYDDGFARTAPVKSFVPNEFGLFDMSGNVWELCADGYDKDYYAKSPGQDPAGPESVSWKVARGGSWTFFGRDVRASKRLVIVSNLSSDWLGFRCAKTLP